LRSFDGTVLLVSHDRALLDAVGTRNAGDRGPQAGEPSGRLGRIRPRARCAKAASGCTRRGCEAPDASDPRRRMRVAIRRRRAAEGGARRAPPAPPSKNRQSASPPSSAKSPTPSRAQALEDELADPSAWASPTGSERSAKRHAEAKGRIESLYEELLALSEE
jgi:ATP-binding cassette subfamily F protein 3